MRYLDRQTLLELAAKAAGINGHYVSITGQGEIEGISTGQLQGPWNPLEDDGEALALAVKLRMRVEVNERSIVVSWNWNEAEAAQPLFEYPEVKAAGHDIVCFGHDKATRRAIVRAAAEIAQAQVPA